MTRWHSILLVAWLAFAFVGGRQLVVLHELGHAADRIAHKDGDTAKHCKIHFACSQLAAAAGSKAPPAVPVAIAPLERIAAHALSEGAAPIPRSIPAVLRIPPPDVEDGVPWASRALDCGGFMRSLFVFVAAAP
jgi:hypothetical protein